MKILIYSSGGAVAAALAARLAESGDEVVSRNPAYWRGEVEAAEAVVVEGERSILKAHGLDAVEIDIAGFLRLGEEAKPGRWSGCPVFAGLVGAEPGRIESDETEGDETKAAPALKAVHKGRGKYDVINAAGDVVASGLDKEASAALTQQ